MKMPPSQPDSEELPSLRYSELVGRLIEGREHYPCVSRLSFQKLRSQAKVFSELLSLDSIIFLPLAFLHFTPSNQYPFRPSIYLFATPSYNERSTLAQISDWIHWVCQRWPSLHTVWTIHRLPIGICRSATISRIQEAILPRCWSW